MIKGMATFTLPKLSSMFYAIVDPLNTIKPDKKKRMQTFQYFGMEDSIHNHLKLLMAHKKKRGTNFFLKSGEDLLKKRYFTV